MFSNASIIAGKLATATLLLVMIACGSASVENTGQSKAVRDRARVLGLALMDDGTYQFRLCRLHEEYTVAILEKECINPLVNDDGSAKTFSSVPERPDALLPTVRNWVTALLAGTISGAVIYKLGRFYVKRKARDRVVGEALLQRKEIEVASARGKTDFELLQKLQQLRAADSRTIEESVVAKAIIDDATVKANLDFVKDYDKEIKTELESAVKHIDALIAEPLSQPKGVIDEIGRHLSNAGDKLQGNEGALGFDLKSVQPELLKLVKAADKLKEAKTKDLDAILKEAKTKDLDAMLKEAKTKDLATMLRDIADRTKGILARLESGEGLSLQQDSHLLKVLEDAAQRADDLKTSGQKLSQVDAALSSWRESRAELALFDDEIRKVISKLKDGKDELVERILRVDDVALAGDTEHFGHDKTLLTLKRAIEDARQAAADAGGDKKALEAASKTLAEAEAELKQRIKSYNPSQNSLRGDMQAAVDAAINKSKAAGKDAPADESKPGLLADQLEWIGTGTRRVFGFLQNFPWVGKDTLKYAKLNRITVTQEREIVEKLARAKPGSNDEIDAIEVRKGTEKLVAQVIGVSAFLTLPLTEWSRHLPGHALLSARRSWDDVTGGHTYAKRIDDLQAILDGIAQATGAKVAPAALIFGR